MWYILTSGLLAALVLIDGTKRQVKSPPIWGLATFLFGPLTLAYYLSTRPLMVDEVRMGGVVWSLSRYFSIVWTSLLFLLAVSELFMMNEHDGIMQAMLHWVGLDLVSEMGLMIHARIWLYPIVATLAVGMVFRRRAANEIGPTGPLAWSIAAREPARSPFVISASGL